MLIKKPSDIPYSEVTPEKLYLESAANSWPRGPPWRQARPPQAVREQSANG